ncbi:MAG: type II toxin-antitoxin system RelB/DinJ family antitoxin [Lachnospiraceae bacterium]|nr:type II toxin-antitoxin system RelB/DinJ family antitoxin [Lachnospiraceae bacterium]
MSATKTANVNARIDLNIKTQAEAILARIGLPRSVAIDAFYRQIIIHGGIPFSLTIPESKLPARDEMSTVEFNQMMTTGLAQAKADDSYDLDEVFRDLES